MRVVSSVMGPTWPNRFYWLSGTSVGQKSNQVPQTYGAPTIFGRLDAKGIDYRIYYSDVPFASLMGNADFALDRHALPIDTFYKDAAAGKLPRVSYLDPPFTSGDDHPPHHPILGQQFIAGVYNALASSPQWERCLFLITYDEHGGFFDHVPPPTTDDERVAEGFGQLGFRVPAILVGPYVKTGHVSSVVRNHVSALKEIEADLSEMIDAGRLARGDARVPAKIPAVDVSQWVIDTSCANGIHLEHDVLRLASENPERVSRYVSEQFFDQRPGVFR